MVVSWRDENQGQEADDRRQMVIANASLGEETSGNESAIMLFFLARIGSWDEFLVRLERISPLEIRETAGPFGTSEPGENILHVVVSQNNVPLIIIETILRLTAGDGAHQGAESMASAQNHRHQTPLHLTVMDNPTRTDLIKCLYDANPPSAQVRDDRQLRPIDEITAKIIMMEEVLKYSQNDERLEFQQRLNSLWATAAVLVGAAMDTDVGDTALLVHACMQSREVPFALTERAMKYNKGQLALPDNRGNLPLHIVARIPPRVAPAREDGSSDIEDDENDDDECDFLERVLVLYPDAACVFNDEQHIPLMVAIQAGRFWQSGVFRLLEINPAGIQELRLPTTMYPYLFEHLADHPDIAYRIMQSMPGIFLGTTTLSDSTGTPGQR